MVRISEPDKGWREHKIWVNSIFGDHYKTFEGEYLGRVMDGWIDPLTKGYHDHRYNLYRTCDGFVVKEYKNSKVKIKKMSEPQGMRKYPRLFRDCGIYREERL